MKPCIEFVLMLFILWLASVMVMFAGACLVLFAPIIILWELLYDEVEE